MSTGEATKSARNPLAALYQRSVLDPMVEIARALSLDFVQRPRQYRGIPEAVGGVLENFRTRIGTSPEWPDTKQREVLFASLFGDAFRTTSTDLQSAAIAFAERRVEMKPDPQEDRVRDAAVAFRDYLRGLDGPAVTRADRETATVFRGAAELFQNKEVAGRFGVSPAPGGNWPFEVAADADAASADGALLIEEIQQAIGPTTGRPMITQHLYVLLQRVAQYGAQTIAAVLEDGGRGKTPDWAPALVRSAYGWATALQSLRSYIEDKQKRLAARVVSPFALDDEQLRSMPTEEDVRRRGPRPAQAQGGGGGGHSCTYGWTLKCDTGPTCYTGFTLKCDTGPTCTSGFTLKCDTGPTCTYGWTSICDDPPGGRGGIGIALAAGGGGVQHNTCNWGFTFLCDDRT
ncbi:MAG: hypothetical protein J2P46_11260, partial [Zavarzinella sp.]|nr:hypothetical protein [Zavarzinella sp.]